MLEYESLNEFYAKLNDIVNSKFNIREKIEYSWIVRKILRSLPRRVRPKLTAKKAKIWTLKYLHLYLTYYDKYKRNF